jgi:hypothetical protein
MNDFSTLAYAKINLTFNKEEFIKEYDERIYPYATDVQNGKPSIEPTRKLNTLWNMVPDDVYDTADYFEQPTDSNSLLITKRQRRVWKMFQLMTLDTEGIVDPLLIKYSSFGTPSLRNETLDKKYFIKEKFKNLKIVKWIEENLPIYDIVSIHCVAIDEDGFSTIHRDMKGLYNSKSSAGINRVYSSGYVTICLNISNGGVPLFWSLDGKDAINCFKTNEDVYLTNDYFLHGVPLCSSRRRQIRITAKPRKEFLDIIDQSSIIDVGKNYNFDPKWPVV